SMSPEERHDRAEQYVAKARLFYLQGDMEEALESYSQALQYDSSHTEALLGSAEIWTQQKRYNDILIALRNLPSKNPRTAYLRGQAYFATSRYNEALVDLLSVLKHPAYGLLALRMTISSYARNGAYAQAVDLLDKELPSHDPATVRDLILERERLHDALLMAEPMRGFEEKKLAVLEKQSTITRSDLAFLAVTLLSLKKDSAGLAFRDVPAQDTMALYYRTAIRCGFLEILPDGKFYPDHIIRRRNLAHYMYRLLSAPDVKLTASPWSDIDPRDPIIAAALWAHQNKVLTPQTGTQFGVDKPVTGLEVKKALERLALLRVEFFK
ncbi:MAG TPA: tetratricopeptide repeat protein, partial [bacterium]|nr:tetratricopeptide repeat protein [bacterium]